MKAAVEKSPIASTHAFVVKDLTAPHFDPNWHFHPEYQLFVVLQGRGTRFVGDHVSPFKEGDMVFTGPNLPHLWRSDDHYFQADPAYQTRGVVIYFHEHFPGEAFLQKEEMIRLKHLLERANRGLAIYGHTARQVRQWMLQMKDMAAFEGVLRLLHILHLLSTTHEARLLASVGYSNTLNEVDTERMNRVHAYVMDNFRQKISLHDVAAIASMTPTSFSRYFKTHANKTFSGFLSEIRIGYACKLLIEDQLNVSEACYACGFQTLSNFNRQFKSITRHTPVQYKKEYISTVTKT